MILTTLRDCGILRIPAALLLRGQSQLNDILQRLPAL
jgi:hypothetical protein